MLSKFHKWLIALKPRYLLSLDEKLYNDQKKSNEYRFKAFGEHNFPVFNYNDILKNKNILYSINPHGLIEIVIDNHINEEKKSQFKVIEHLRGNKYRLKSSYLDKVLEGIEICASPALLEKINPLNVYQIAYNTGFIDGRAVSKELMTNMESHHEPRKITKLKIVSNNG